MPTRKTQTVRQAAAAKRAAALAAEAKYDAAGYGRRIKSWNPASSGPNAALEGFERLRNRSRDAIRNDWQGASSEQKWTTTLIGTGIVPRWEDDQLTELWEASRPELDADGVCDVYGLQALATRGFVGAGESFLRQRPRSLDAPLTSPVQVQLIEGDYCPRFDADTWAGMPAGNTIRSGKERNKFGRVVAYWFYRSHPGERDGVPSMGDLIRVPASEVAHLYEPRRAGLLRGVSDLASVLTRIRASGNLEDAVLDRQLLANLFTMFITKQLPTDYRELKTDPNTGLPMHYTKASGTPMVGLEPGISQELLPGEDVKFANPPEPGVSHSDYLRSLGLGTASGMGLPYELFSGDIRDVGDRVLRVIINEFRRYAEQRQWLWIIPQHCMPVVRWWAEGLFLKGTINAAQYEKAIRPAWNPQGWEYIHPVQDVEGAKLAVEAGFTSRTAVILKRGDDPKAILKQRVQDAKDEEDVPKPVPPAPAAGTAPAGKPPEPTMTFEVFDSWFAKAAAKSIAPPPSPPPAPQGVPVETVQLMFEQFNRHASALVDVAQAAIAQRGDTHLHASVAAPHVTNNVEPTPVHVTAEVKVEPTPVTIENTVEATLHMPPRESKTTVIYDDETGQIRESTTTETTVQLQ